MEQPHPLPHIRSPCRRSCDTNSPEFEFSMVGNPSFPQPNLLSADQLFSGGFLLPLHLLQLSTQPPPPPPQDTEATEPSSIIESSTNSTTNNSSWWRHIFKKNLVPSSISTRSSADDHPTKEKDVREKDAGAVAFGAGNVVSAAELNINIWPFSRSRSAGNGGARPRPAPATRKVSSAPCSRCNSTGDQSKSRKWPHSPARPGVHLGRNSPVWQVRRGGGRSSKALAKNVENGAKRDGRKIPASKARVLSLNVPMCIGYRNHLSCRHDVRGASAGGGGGGQIEGGVSGEVVRRSNLFNIRSIFNKTVN